MLLACECHNCPAVHCLMLTENCVRRILYMLKMVFTSVPCEGAIAGEGKGGRGGGGLATRASIAQIGRFSLSKSTIVM